MKASTTIVASSIARAPERIVSAPSWGLIFCSLIGSLTRAAGRLPALSTPTRKSTSDCLKLPVIWPSPEIVLRSVGADRSVSSSRMPSRLVSRLAGSGRFCPVSVPKRAAPEELNEKLTHGCRLLS